MGETPSQGGSRAQCAPSRRRRSRTGSASRRHPAFVRGFAGAAARPGGQLRSWAKCNRCEAVVNGDLSVIGHVLSAGQKRAFQVGESSTRELSGASHRARWRTNASAAFWFAAFSARPAASHMKKVLAEVLNQLHAFAFLCRQNFARAGVKRQHCNSLNSRLFQALRMNLAYRSEAVKGWVEVICSVPPGISRKRTGLLVIRLNAND